MVKIILSKNIYNQLILLRLCFHLICFAGTCKNNSPFENILYPPYYIRSFRPFNFKGMAKYQPHSKNIARVVIK